MCEKSLPLEKIAIKLGRNIGICRSAIKKLKNEKEIEKDQVTPQSAVASELQESFQPVDYYPDPGDELLFNFIPLPAHQESTTLSEQKIVIPRPPAKKRKALAEGAKSIPKKVKIPISARKKDTGSWSPNQNAAVLRAIERADSWRVNHELLLEEVNALAVKGDGGHHSKEGCYSKVYKVQKKIKNQLNKTD